VCAELGKGRLAALAVLIRDGFFRQQVSAAPDWSISAFPRIAEMLRSFIFAQCGAHKTAVHFC
jgi:hypothetical protein